MFRYSEGMDKYVNSRRKAVIEKNNERFENLRASIEFFCTNPIYKEITCSYLNALDRCTNQIYNSSESTISLIANLRFLFETSITTRLLVREEGYKYKVRYSIYKHQLDKSQSLTKYAQVDVEKLSELDKRERELIQSPSSENILDVKNQTDELYDQLDEEIALFLDNAELNGASRHKTFIAQYLNQHKQRELDISREWEETKKELLKDSEASRIFNFKNQLSKVEKELKDTRSWQEKAFDAELSEMYAFVYDYTSSLIHSTSYSVMVPNQLDESEKTMIMSLATRITSDILKNLKVFSGVPNMVVMRVDG
jgi:hypothetical protein